MIINNLDLVSIIVMPLETNPPLPVYWNTVLTGAISFQRLESISRRNPQVVYVLSIVNHPQFPPRNSLNIFW